MPTSDSLIRLQPQWQAPSHTPTTSCTSTRGRAMNDVTSSPSHPKPVPPRIASAIDMQVFCHDTDNAGIRPITASASCPRTPANRSIRPLVIGTQSKFSYSPSSFCLRACIRTVVSNRAATVRERFLVGCGPLPYGRVSEKDFLNTIKETPGVGKAGMVPIDAIYRDSAARDNAPGSPAYSSWHRNSRLSSAARHRESQAWGGNSPGRSMVKSSASTP